MAIKKEEEELKYNERKEKRMVGEKWQRRGIVGLGKVPAPSSNRRQ
ncbi:MAG: hypothetical protein NZ901_05985 [Geminocystis sp.]|nr:hypothetical protein [Geminocystis sp.]